MFPCAYPVCSAPNASGGRETMLSGAINVQTTFAGHVTKTDFNGAIPPSEASRIVVTVSYQRIHVLGSNNITVTAG